MENEAFKGQDFYCDVCDITGNLTKPIHDGMNIAIICPDCETVTEATVVDPYLIIRS